MLTGDWAEVCPDWEGLSWSPWTSSMNTLIPVVIVCSGPNSCCQQVASAQVEVKLFFFACCMSADINITWFEFVPMQTICP